MTAALALQRFPTPVGLRRMHACMPCTVHILSCQTARTMSSKTPNANMVLNNSTRKLTATGLYEYAPDESFDS